MQSVTLQGNIGCAEDPAGWLYLHRLAERPPAAACARVSEGRLVMKWDLENKKPMKGKASARVLKLIAELEAKGRL